MWNLGNVLAYTILVENVQERNDLGHLGVFGIIIIGSALNYILEHRLD